MTSIIAIWTLICSIIFHRSNKIKKSEQKEEESEKVRKEETDENKKIISAEKSSMEKFCKGFAVQENFTSIVASERNLFPAFNGFRIIGSFSIIYFHIYYYSLSATDNIQFAFTFSDSFIAMPMFSAILVVDNFFILSGFLLAYTIREQQKKNLDLNKKFLARKILSRYFRVNPSFLFVSKRLFLFQCIIYLKRNLILGPSNVNCARFLP